MSDEKKAENTGDVNDMLRASIRSAIGIGSLLGRLTGYDAESIKLRDQLETPLTDEEQLRLYDLFREEDTAALERTIERKRDVEDELEKLTKEVERRQLLIRMWVKTRAEVAARVEAARVEAARVEAAEATPEAEAEAEAVEADDTIPPL